MKRLDSILPRRRRDSDCTLRDGSRIAVVGGGPAGSLFGYFLLDMSERMGIEISVDLFEPRDFRRPAPAGCNMCGCIISESLVQNLATDGINLPASVIERGIESYVLHMDVGNVKIETPLREKRIGAAFRGAGPRGVGEVRRTGFDAFLLSNAERKGVRILRDRVDTVHVEPEGLRLKTRGGREHSYDALVAASGVNTSFLRDIGETLPSYRPPRTMKTFIGEFALGPEKVQSCFGDSMHVFLLDIERLEFAALIPKDAHVTLCLLGDRVDKDLIGAFLDSTEVKACFPPDVPLDRAACRCMPQIVKRGADVPYADRIVFIGDAGVTRLYKDGIGAAYRTAKAAASTIVFQGFSDGDFKRKYGPVCRSLRIDNSLGRIVFSVTRLIQASRFARRAVLRLIMREQANERSARRMSRMLWDTFTGSAPYREILLRTLHPGFGLGFARELGVSLLMEGRHKIRSLSNRLGKRRDGTYTG